MPENLLMRKYKRRNLAVGLSLAAGVLGIYVYSMYAVKQESFLDEDFDKSYISSTKKNNWSQLMFEFFV